jgi:hypothetical protein
MRVIAGITAAAVLIATTGCATSSKDVASAYVSPIQYQSYDCDQLAAESQRLTGRVQQLGGRLDEAANNDKVLTGVALLLFWPAAFAIGGTKTQEAEYARMKGEADAIQQSAVAKKCPGAMTAPPAAKPVQEVKAQPNYHNPMPPGTPGVR